MSTPRRLSLALATSLGLLLAAPAARAGEPQVVSPAEEEALYKQERATALPAKEKAAAAAPGKFAVEGCFADPSLCKCQNTDASKSQFCGTLLGTGSTTNFRNSLSLPFKKRTNERMPFR